MKKGGRNTAYALFLLILVYRRLSTCLLTYWSIGVECNKFGISNVNRLLSVSVNLQSANCEIMKLASWIQDVVNFLNEYTNHNWVSSSDLPAFFPPSCKSVPQDSSPIVMCTLISLWSNRFVKNCCMEFKNDRFPVHAGINKSSLWLGTRAALLFEELDKLVPRFG